ncbi:MAG: bifunctional folylpolyglutamate synthase/dihydrofolate synthase [Oscillospiraceae bacterium]
MTIEQAMELIHGVEWRGSRPGLSRVRELLHRLGDPQDGLQFVHIAGTNGKGSTAAMLASILRAAGYTTGLFTSPYLERFAERMQVNGAPVPDAEFAAVCQTLQPCIAAMDDPPTEFELVTAAAMLWFRRRGCDVVVLEVGLGGRLDATNVIAAPACAVITNIGLDHTEILGGTLAQIAREKAGILKPGTCAVSYPQAQEVRSVLREICAQRGIPLTEVDVSAIVPLTDSVDGQTFTYRGAEYALPLLGAHQLRNAAVALETVAALRARGWRIPDAAVHAGLAQVRWPARFELLRRAPWFVLDGGHNPQCAQTVADNLARYFPGRRITLLVGVLADKDYPPCSPRSMGRRRRTSPRRRARPARCRRRAGEYLKRFGKPVTVCAPRAGGRAGAGTRGAGGSHLRGRLAVHGGRDPHVSAEENDENSGH